MAMKDATQEQTVEVELTRLGSGGPRREGDLVAREEPLEIRLNGEWLTTLMRTPGLEKELAIGFCLSEGVVPDASEIQVVRFCGTGSDELLPQNVVEVMCGTSDTDRTTLARISQAGAYRRGLRATSCGICGTDIANALRQEIPYVSDSFTVKADTILECAERLGLTQEVFRATGGTHAACLADRTGDVAASCEDIGRHNAVDKAVGVAATRGLEVSCHFLVVSGRVSYEIAAKAARLKIPVVASVSAPTSMGVEICRDLGITLAGFVRNRRMNVYSHPFRIVSD